MKAFIPYVKNTRRPFREGLLESSNQFHLETGKCMMLTGGLLPRFYRLTDLLRKVSLIGV